MVDIFDTAVYAKFSKFINGIYICEIFLFDRDVVTYAVKADLLYIMGMLFGFIVFIASIMS